GAPEALAARRPAPLARPPGRGGKCGDDPRTPPAATRSPEAPAEPTIEGSLPAQALMMFRAFLASPLRNKLILLGVGLVAVIGATAFGQVRLNAWNRPFYDALARRDAGTFLDQLVVFAVIASGLLALNV